MKALHMLCSLRRPCGTIPIRMCVGERIEGTEFRLGLRIVKVCRSLRKNAAVGGVKTLEKERSEQCHIYAGTYGT